LPTTGDHPLTPFNNTGVLSDAREERGHGSPDVQLGMPPMGIVRLSPVVGDFGSEPILAQWPMDVDTFSNMVNCNINKEEQLAPAPLLGPHHVHIGGVPYDPSTLPLTHVLSTPDTPDVIDMTEEEPESVAPPNQHGPSTPLRGRKGSRTPPPSRSPRDRSPVESTRVSPRSNTGKGRYSNLRESHMARYAADSSDDPTPRTTGTMFLTSPSMFRDDLDEILHEYDSGFASYMNPSCMVAELDFVPMDHASAVLASLQEEEGCGGIPVTTMSSKLQAASDHGHMPKSVKFKS
jgi:hypothetical protein